VGDTIASQFIRYDLPGLTVMIPQPSFEKPFCSLLVAGQAII